jgi:hypothetical protein
MSEIPKYTSDAYNQAREPFYSVFSEKCVVGGSWIVGAMALIHALLDAVLIEAPYGTHALKTSAHGCPQISAYAVLPPKNLWEYLLSFTDRLAKAAEPYSNIVANEVDLGQGTFICDITWQDTFNNRHPSLTYEFDTLEVRLSPNNGWSLIQESGPPPFSWHAETFLQNLTNILSGDTMDDLETITVTTSPGPRDDSTANDTSATGFHKLFMSKESGLHFIGGFECSLPVQIDRDGVHPCSINATRDYRYDEDATRGSYQDMLSNLSITYESNGDCVTADNPDDIATELADFPFNGNARPPLEALTRNHWRPIEFITMPPTEAESIDFCAKLTDFLEKN